MKFLCLAYYDPAKFDALSDAQRQAIVSQCPRFDEALIATGALLMHGSLATPADSGSVRPRGGKPLVVDGPYAETKEHVGGFFMIEARDLAEASTIASLHPAAQLGESVGWGIEIRPIGYFKEFAGTPA